MRRLKRNQREFTYQLYLGKEDGTDTQGYKDGRKKKSYSDPVTEKGCVVFRGTSSVKPYGVEEDFSVQIIPDHKIDITAESKIIIDGKEYRVTSAPVTMNEQRIYAK